MIPKVIHYCWFGGKPLPRSVKKCIASWRKFCPDYEIVEWNERNFDVNCHSFVKAAYDSQAWAFVSDYARLKIIYEHGGVYLDTDVELLKNLDGLLKQKCFFATQQDIKNVATGLGFGAEKHNPVVRKMMRAYDDIAFDKDNLANIACPIISREVMNREGYVFKKCTQQLKDCTVYPPEYFDPVAPGDSKDLLSNKSFSIHHYDATWTSTGNRWKRFLMNRVGQGRANKIKKLIDKGKLLRFLVTVGLLFILFSNVLFKLLDFPDFVGYWDEAIELSTVVLATVWFVRFKEYKKMRKHDFIFVISFVGVVCIGLLGNIFFRYMDSVEAIFRDLVVFAKFPLVYYVLQKMQFNKKVAPYLPKCAGRLVEIITVVLFVFGILNIFVDLGMSSLADVRLGMRPYMFLYSHPTYLVLSCVILLAILNYRNKKSLIYEIMLLVVIVLSGRTKGIVMVAAYLFVKYVPAKIKNNKILYAVLLGIIVAAFSFSKLSLYASFSSSPREQLYNGAFVLSTEDFPIGGGFASFASHISGRYDSKAYRVAGVTFYNPDTGYGAEDLGDAGYAYYLGQFGWLGLICLCMSVYGLYVTTKLGNRGVISLPVQVIVMYILIALTTETTLLNCGIELAFVLAVFNGNKIGTTGHVLEN